MNIRFIVCTCAAAFALAGCEKEIEHEHDREMHAPVARSPIAAKDVKHALRRNFQISHGEDAEHAALSALRRSGDTNAYLRAAREYLKTNDDDILAADVLTIYANRRDADDFRSFALDWAHPLEAAEIADNESWTPMCAEFAHIAANDPKATFGQLLRAAQFIADTPDDHLDESVMRRLEKLAKKHYQQEDVAILKCIMEFRREGLCEDSIHTLEDLSRNAMMPQVRQKAAELLDASF